MGEGGRDQRPLNLRKGACQEEAPRNPKNDVLTPIFQCQYGVESWNKWGLTLQINYGRLLLVTGLEIANGGNLYSTSLLDTGKTNAYLIGRLRTRTSFSLFHLSQNFLRTAHILALPDSRRSNMSPIRTHLLTALSLSSFKFLPGWAQSQECYWSNGMLANIDFKPCNLDRPAGSQSACCNLGKSPADVC